MTAPVYLDHNATTPVLPEVVDAMLPYLREHFGNPSSLHVYGRAAAHAIAEARAQVASLIGASPDEIVFTSCGTEASNLAITGAVSATGRRTRILTSTIEHPATRAPVDALAAAGHEAVWLPVDEAGRLELDRAREALSTPADLVSVMHANNETGVLQPISELAALARAAGASVHTDAAQSLGKVAVQVDELGVDLVTIAGHKLYAPKGIGALYRRRGTPLHPVLLGAGHEGGLRPGTENVAYIAGLGAACAIAARDLQAEAARQAGLRDALTSQLHVAVPGIVVHGEGSPRLPNTLNLRFPGVRGADLLAACPRVAASTGSACHEGVWSPSAVLLAMGVPAEAALGAVRISLGRGTTADQVQIAADALIAGWVQLTQGAS